MKTHSLKLVGMINLRYIYTSILQYVIKVHTNSEAIKLETQTFQRYNTIIAFFIQFNINITSLPIISFGYNKGKIRETKKLQNEKINFKTTTN